MIPVFFVGLHGIGKTSILFKNENCLPKCLKSLGYTARSYSCDNYKVYTNVSMFHAQIDRNYYASRKFGEAIQDSPEIALFDRSMFCNLLYSKCFMEFGLMSEAEFESLKKQFQTLKNRELCFEGSIFFLNLPVERVIEQVNERNSSVEGGREDKINSMLTSDEFLRRLHNIYVEFYGQYQLTNPVYMLEEYSEDIILEEMKKHDIIQVITE